ncbi:cytochrome P450- family 86- subfamily C-polypeptide 3 [Striga hermonthica]|uniref:Cytochrome P450- family 86- subfamily C-polypeptide 3 n=1 Tax=Striga hermonthica TaxID=68872 RepID=A0A9N7ND46_STRHE|nr:cytochrome P450- family 86- subfamily C-polypeptide 3 [Striga hermonthica]
MDEFTYLSVFVAITCFLVLIAWKNSRSPILDCPVLGMLPSLLLSVGQIHDACTETFAKSERGTFRFRGPPFSGMDMLCTVDPANVHHILTGNFRNFPKGPAFREIFDILGNGIFNSDHGPWREQRSLARILLARPAFRRFLAKTSLEKLERGIIPVLEMFSREGRVADLQDLFQRFTFDTTCVLVAGHDPGCLTTDFPDVPFARALDHAEVSVFMRHVVPEWVWRLQRRVGVGEERKLREARGILDSVINDFIVEKRIRDELKMKISPAEERGKLRVFGVEEVKDLVYLHSAVCEALRLYPPVPFQHKEPLGPDVLPSGHCVGPGMKVVISLYAMGRMESIWGEDCLEFKPERWISKVGMVRHEPSYKFLAFNAGPRTCLGKEMAFAQVKAVAATLIYNYRIRVAEGHSVEPNCSIILYMKNGFKVRVANRWSCE